MSKQMQVYEVTAPDGTVLEVTGPAGASHEEVIRQAQMHYQPKAPAAPPPDERTALQVAGDQAINVVKGIPQLVTSIPGMVAELGGIVKDTVTGNAKQANDRVMNMAKGVAAPITTSARGLGALVAPGTVDAPSRQDWEQAAQGAGANAAGVAVGALLPAAFAKIPTTAKAGAKFEQVMGKAKDVPLDTTAADAALARAQELRQRGSTLPKVLNDYSKQQKTGAPMAYEAGRDFASNAGALSTREVTAMNSKMQRQVGEFAQAMRTANREAAVKVGMGDIYDQAMKEYRQAKNLQQAGQTLKKWAGTAALTALGLKGLHEIWP